VREIHRRRRQSGGFRALREPGVRRLRVLTDAIRRGRASPHRAGPASTAYGLGSRTKITSTGQNVQLNCLDRP